MILAGIETGGTTCRLALWRDGEVVRRAVVPTTSADGTIVTMAKFFAPGPQVDAVGLAAFGPIDLRPGPGHGTLLATPKPGWSGAPLVARLREAIGAPVYADTDVNAAALAEARWGAARGHGNVAYLTIGTGVGAGILHDGVAVHGLAHPEVGHLRVGKAAGDTFPGTCPYHGDCLEGLVSAPAITARCGAAPDEIDAATRARVVPQIAAPVADGLRSLVYAAAPEVIVMGGGISRMEGLYDATRELLAQSLAAFPGLPEHQDPGFLVRPGLGDDAGLMGALVLAGVDTEHPPRVAGVA